MVMMVATPTLASSAEWLAAWPLLVRMAARRPASWLAAVMACVAVWSAESLEVMAVVTLATLAAGGAPPTPGISRPPAGWLAARLVWPLAGLALGGVLYLVWPCSPNLASMPSVMAAAALALLLTAVTLWAVGRAGATAAIGLTPADTVSLAMATAAASVSVGSVADSWQLAAASWAALVPVGAFLVRWLHDGADAPLSRGASDMVAGLLSQSPIRRSLGRAAMVTMLAAMVGWLLLDPTQAGRAAALAATSMLSLAGPVAAFQAGTVADVGWPWEAVWRSTPGLRPGRRLLAGGAGLAVETVSRHAAILGWPSLVAAAVAVGTSTGPWPALLVAATIVVAAGLLVAVVVICRGLSFSGDTALATVLAVAVAALLLLSMAASRDIAAIRLDLPDFPQ